MKEQFDFWGYNPSTNQECFIKLVMDDTEMIDAIVHTEATNRKEIKGLSPDKAHELGLWLLRWAHEAKAEELEDEFDSRHDGYLMD